MKKIKPSVTHLKASDNRDHVTSNNTRKNHSYQLSGMQQKKVKINTFFIFESVDDEFDKI